VVPHPARRWGLLKQDVDYLAGGQGHQPDRALQAGRRIVGVPVPKSDFRTSKLIDGVVWDGKDPKKYAASFKIGLTCRGDGPPVPPPYSTWRSR
jgi:nitrate/nitrite transport system substrate-binding protein